MRLAILSRNKNLYSTRRLVEAAEARGHDVRVLNTLKCYMDIASHRPSIHYGGEELPPFDAVIPRIGASVTFYGAAVLRQFEMKGAYPLNESVAITRSRDKLRSMPILVRTPQSGILRSIVALGARLEYKELLGFVSDPFGDAETAIQAPCVGIVIGRTNLPLVHQGEAVFHIARFEAVHEVAQHLEAFQTNQEEEMNVDPEPTIV